VANAQPIAALKEQQTMSNFEKELYEQPDVVARLIAEESEHAGRLAAEMRRRGVQYVMVAGRGTSDNAGVYGKYLFAAMNGIPVAMATPSLFSIYDTPPRFGDALVLGISQSGQSPDIVSVLAEARQQGVLTAAFTNDPESPLAQQADHVLALHAGPELSVAATKTYTAQLAAVALLNAALSGDTGFLTALRAAPAAMRSALELAPEVARIAERYRFTDRLVVLGRGYNLATAQEIALKLKETNYIAAEPYSPADFIHGPTAMVDENCPVMVVAPSGARRRDPGPLRRRGHPGGRTAETAPAGERAGVAVAAGGGAAGPAAGPAHGARARPRPGPPARSQQSHADTMRREEQDECSPAQ
jgi:glucosamine--fructose-6-phosphate aminotransferase (isomerizing)